MSKRRSIPKETQRAPDWDSTVYQEVPVDVEGTVGSMELMSNDLPSKFKSYKDKYKEITMQRIQALNIHNAEDFVNTLEERARGLVSIHERFKSILPGHLKMTEEVALELLNRLARGELLKDICKDAHMPSYTTVMKWIKTDPDFQEAYISAQEFRMHMYADEILKIADDTVGDVKLAYDKNGNLIPEVNYENIQRSKLRIQTRQYLMERFAKQTYALQRESKATVQSSDGATVNVQINLPDNGRPIAGAIEK